MSFAKIEDAVDAIRGGEFVVVVDDAGRENEGDLIISAQCASTHALSFMVRHTSGLVCVATSGARLDELQLPLMVASNSEAQGTAFTISVDVKHGTSTGISAADRSATIRALADPSFHADDFARPGHVFPLRYAEGGVLKRPGHTEAAVDLASLAGHPPAGALCEIVNDDGSMARLSDLQVFAEVHGLLVVNIADLIAYRLRHEVWQRGDVRADDFLRRPTPRVVAADSGHPSRRILN
jgi:3,4-dihydroxy-2-butanone 4-phosphate synthase